jgi:hypothetical protein
MERHEIRFNRATLRSQKKLGEGKWQGPILRTWVLVNSEGKVCAVVRELGRQFPKKDRRYSARIDGVEWWTTNILSPEYKYLPLRGFKSPKEAMAAIDAARTIILNSTEEDVV